MNPLLLGASPNSGKRWPSHAAFCQGNPGPRHALLLLSRRSGSLLAEALYFWARGVSRIISECKRLAVRARIVPGTKAARSAHTFYPPSSFRSVTRPRKPRCTGQGSVGRARGSRFPASRSRYVVFTCPLGHVGALGLRPHNNSLQRTRVPSSRFLRLCGSPLNLISLGPITQRGGYVTGSRDTRSSA